MFSLDVEKVEGRVQVKLSGMIDSTTSEEFAKSIEEVLLEKPKELTLNFGEVDYISSAGFRILFMIAKEMKSNGGKVEAIEVPPEIDNLFSMVHLDHVIDIAAKQ